MHSFVQVTILGSAFTVLFCAALSLRRVAPSSQKRGHALLSFFSFFFGRWFTDGNSAKRTELTDLWLGECSNSLFSACFLFRRSRCDFSQCVFRRYISSFPRTLSRWKCSLPYGTRWFPVSSKKYCAYTCRNYVVRSSSSNWLALISGSRAHRYADAPPFA